MFVLIDQHLAISLHEASDLKTFKLVCLSPISMQRSVSRALSSIDSLLEGGHAWICVAWLRCQPAVAQDLVWQSAFTELLVFAHRKGWTDVDQRLVRAHVEWRHDTATAQ